MFLSSVAYTFCTEPKERMLASISWDVWAAAILAAAVALVEVFGAGLATLIALYISICTYFIIESFT
jgi:hypothetical protein